MTHLKGLGLAVMLELIDTLWNVNKSLELSTCHSASELIDTLWNVNIIYSLMLLLQPYRINRYIMECKSEHKRLWNVSCKN